MSDVPLTWPSAGDLRSAEQRNRMLVEQLPLVTYIEPLDQASASYISPQIEQLAGYTPAEWTADPDFFAKVLHADDRQAVLDAFARMHRTGEPLHCEYRIHTRDGRIVWIDDAAVVVRDEHGAPLYAQGFMLDVSERKQAEQALRENERRVADLVEGIDVILWEADAQFRFSFVSRRAEDILGYPIEQWLSDPQFVVGHFHPEDRDRVVAADEAVSETGADYELEYRILAADGRAVWFHEIVRVERDESGAVKNLRGVMVDITTQKRAAEEHAYLEEQLRQALKMEAVGRLAGGIAHDFNNLLTAISGYSSLALQRLGTDHSAVRSDLEEIEASTQRAAALTQQLLAFSRQQVMRPKLLDLNVVVRDVEKLLRRLIGEEIEIEIVTGDEHLPVEADPAQIDQVLINLAINARDAMPAGGHLTMTTTFVEARDVPVLVGRSGRFARLCISDTGHGMDPATKARLFEPFFTTKDVGKGTGLGLATVYGIVQQSAGHVRVESELGAGTTFEVYLPLQESRTPATRGNETAGSTPGHEVLLLVEDEEAVRNLAREALEYQGYRVLTAALPDEAIALADQNGYDLLVTDVVMPQMRGGELAKRLRTTRPDLRVLFMSGYLDGETVLGDGSDPHLAFLQKPFMIGELSGAVRTLLDRP